MSSNELPSNAAETQQLLRRLGSAQATLYLSFAQDSHLYRTRILEVDADKSCLRIEALSPDTGHNAMVEGQPFNVLTTLEDVQISFTSQIIQLDTTTAQTTYLIDIPRDLRHHQRRTRARAAIPTTLPLPIVLTPASNMTLKVNASVVDLSEQGLCFTTEDEAISPFLQDAGERLYATFEMLEQPLEVQLEMRHHYTTPALGQMVGTRFVYLTPTAQKVIRHFMGALGR